MFKPLSIIVCMCLAAGAALAQPAKKQNPFEELQHLPGWSILEKQWTQAAPNNTTLKTTTGSGQRLIAVSSEEDSFRFAWSGTRELHHHIDPSGILANIEYKPFALSTLSLPDYNSRRPLLHADTVIHLPAYAPPGSPTEFLRTNYRYDANNLITFYGYKSAYYPEHYSDIFYGSNGITQIDQYMDVMQPQDSSFMLYSSMYNTYDANGWLIQDSIVNYYAIPNPTYTLHYYDKDATGRDTSIRIQQGQVGGSVFPSLYRYSLTYDASGRLHKVLYYDLFSVPPAEAVRSKDSLAYTGAGTYPSYYSHKVFDVPTGSVTDEQRAYFSFNANGDVQQKKLLDLDDWTMTFDTTARYQYFYNASYNPDSIIVWALTGSVWMYDTVVQRYYNVPTAGIDNAPEIHEVALTLKPNPATNHITLITLFYKATRGTASIYDMQGRLVQQCGIVKAEQSVDVSRLPAGVYLVQYAGGDGGVGTARFVKE